MESQTVYDLTDIQSLSIVCSGCDAEIVRRFNASNESAYIPARCPFCNLTWAQNPEDDPSADDFYQLLRELTSKEGKAQIRILVRR